MAFDRKRPYGEILGDRLGRRYTQDGMYYTSRGEPWQDPEAGAGSQNPPPAKPARKKFKRKPFEL